MNRRGAQQLLRTAAAQTVLTAERGPDGIRRPPQTSTLPTEGTPSRAGFLSDSTARNDGVIFTARLKKRGTLGLDALVLITFDFLC